MPRCLFRRCANIEFTGEGGARQADQSQAAVAGWQGLIFWQAGAANGQRLTAGDGQSLTNGSIFVAAVLSVPGRTAGLGPQRNWSVPAPRQRDGGVNTQQSNDRRPQRLPTATFPHLHALHSIGCSYRCIIVTRLAPGHRSAVLRRLSASLVRTAEAASVTGLADRTPPT